MGVIGIARDITECNRLQAERDRLVERRRLQIDRLPLAFILIDENNRVLDWNPAAEKMFGYTREEAVGKVCLDLIVTLAADDQVQMLLRRISAGDMDAHSVNDSRTKNGRIITCQWFNTPLLEADGRFAGVISLAEDITEQERAATAAREYSKRLQNLSRRLLNVGESERRSLALELHDEIGQHLTGLKLLLGQRRNLSANEVGPSLEQARSIVDDLLKRVRGLPFDLRPAVLDQLGLIPALLALFDRYTDSTKVRVNLEHSHVDRRFAPEIESAAYRIIQKGLTNVARHAHVGDVTVRVWSTADLLNLQIDDRGQGFEPEITFVGPRSCGISGTQERVTLLNGRLTFESHPGAGTLITAVLPHHRPEMNEK